MTASKIVACPRVVDSKKARFSRMTRAVMKSSTLHNAFVASSYVAKSACIMATLTYRKDVEPSANDIRGLIRHAKKWADRRGFKLRYVWVAELTKKGKLHYHILFFLPPRQKLPMFDRRGWWKFGSTRLEWARNAVAYMAKYASKGGGKGRSLFPKGFRLHGCGGLEKDERNERRYHLAPGWVRHFFELNERPKPCKGGGWFSAVDGTFQASPYFLLSASAGRVVIGTHKWYVDFLNSLEQTQLEQAA